MIEFIINIFYCPESIRIKSYRGFHSIWDSKSSTWLQEINTTVDNFLLFLPPQWPMNSCRVVGNDRCGFYSWCCQQRHGRTESIQIKHQVFGKTIWRRQNGLKTTSSLVLTCAQMRDNTCNLPVQSLSALTSTQWRWASHLRGGGPTRASYWKVKWCVVDGRPVQRGKKSPLWRQSNLRLKIEKRNQPYQHTTKGEGSKNETTSICAT